MESEFRVEKDKEEENIIKDIVTFRKWEIMLFLCNLITLRSKKIVKLACDSLF